MERRKRWWFLRCADVAEEKKKKRLGWRTEA